MSNPLPPSDSSHPSTRRDAELNAPALRSLADGPTAPLQTRHPRGLMTLFMTEMWERFSYYGMKALLVVFLITVLTPKDLAPGVHSTKINFKDKTNDQIQVRTKHIAVDDLAFKAGPPAPVGGFPMQVTPAEDSISAGSRTGDAKFTNPKAEYTLKNTSDKDLEYSVSIDQPKDKPYSVTISEGTSPVTGKLAPGGTVTLEVGINERQSGLGWSKEQSGDLLALYTGLVYLLPIVGGYLADRYLGTHRCLLIGGAIIAAGHFVLMMDSLPSLYTGLGLVIVGTGFFKSNVSTMVGQLYQQGDPKRDAGFTIFYMGINLGAFIAPLICAWLRQKYGWSYGFGAAGVGMVLGLIQYSISKPKHLKGIGDKPNRALASKAGEAASQPLTREEKQRIAVILIMAFFVIFFWTAFEQAAGSMGFFGQERTDRTLPSWLGWLVEAEPGKPAIFPAEWFQSVNSLMILFLAPVFASFWVRLARTRVSPSTPTKMAFGLITLGLGFVFMVLGAQASEGGVKVSPFWLCAAFLVHTCGELCLSPVGLSLVSKLAPLKFASLLMGTWFLANFIANFLAGKLSGQVDKISEAGFILPGQAGFFLIFVIAPCSAGVLLLLLVPILKKMMHGRG